MRLSSTDSTAVILRIPAQPEPAEGTGPESWTPTGTDLPSEPEPLTNPRLTVLTWLVPLLVAAGIGYWALAVPGLGEDELNTWGMVSAGWSDFRALLPTTDATVAPYYLLLRGWVAMAGGSDLVLRLPSVLFSAGAAALVAAIGIRLGGRRVGLAAGLMFALLPAVSRYAQEAGPQSLTVFAAALSTLVLLQTIDSPHVARYLAYALTIVLLGLGHIIALLLLLAHAVMVWQLDRSRRSLIGWGSAALAGLAGVVPLLYLGSGSLSGQFGWIPRLSWARLGETPPLLFGDTLIAGAIVALALTALSMRRPATVVTAWAVVPTAGLALASLITPLWVPRYLLFVLPAWILLASLTLRSLTILRGLTAVLVIAALAVPTQTALRTVGGHGIASRDISAVIKANGRPGDTVLFGPFANADQRTSRDAFMRYLRPEERPLDKLMVQAPRVHGSLGAQECPDVDVPTCFGRPDRVWVVRKGKFQNVLQDIGPAKEQLLRQNFVQSRIWPLKGFTIALYIRKPAA